MGFERGGSRTSMYKHTEATPDFNMKNLVKLPPGEDLDDFIATHVVDFYNRAKLVYSTVVDTNDKYKTKNCSELHCPVMSGGPKYEYLWQVRGLAVPQPS